DLPQGDRRARLALRRSVPRDLQGQGSAAAELPHSAAHLRGRSSGRRLAPFPLRVRSHQRHPDRPIGFPDCNPRPADPAVSLLAQRLCIGWWPPGNCLERRILAVLIERKARGVASRPLSPRQQPWNASKKALGAFQTGRPCREKSDSWITMAILLMPLLGS